MVRVLGHARVSAQVFLPGPDLDLNLEFQERMNTAESLLRYHVKRRIAFRNGSGNRFTAKFAELSGVRRGQGGRRISIFWKTARADRRRRDITAGKEVAA